MDYLVTKEIHLKKLINAYKAWILDTACKDKEIWKEIIADKERELAVVQLKLKGHKDEIPTSNISG